MKQLFKDQVVFITGASSGLGEALALQFYNHGAVLALSARREDRLNNLANKLKERVYVYPLDIRNHESVQETVDKIVKDLKKIDVVVANAGYSVAGPFMDMTEGMWRNLFDTNVFGSIWTIKASIPHLINSKGRLAITTSVAGKVAFSGNSAYAASKYALTAISNSLYQELYPYGVSVTNLAPGMIHSEIGKIDNYGVLHENRIDKRPGFLLNDTEKAAKEMLKAIYLRKRESVITTHGKFITNIASLLPSLTYFGLAKAQMSYKKE